MMWPALCRSSKGHSHRERSAPTLHEQFPSNIIGEYSYYPALNGEPALSMYGHLMDPELEKLLPRYNEEFLKRTEYPRCPFPRR